MWIRFFLSEAAIVAGLFLLVKKMELRLKWAIPWVLLISTVCLWLTSRPGLTVSDLSFIFRFLLAAFLSIGASVCAVLALFFRDPRRIPPVQAGSILSPADGKIIYIKRVEGGRFPIAVKKGKDIPLAEFTGEPFPLEKGYQIGIMMSYLDVHINRAPIAGTIQRMKRIPGSFHSLKHMDSLLENERVFSTIAGPEMEIGMVQIASRFVRRIVAFVSEGELVLQGDRIGMIRFGSQVDLFLPNREDLIVVAKVGNYVKAGLSVLARYGEQSVFGPRE